MLNYVLGILLILSIVELIYQMLPQCGLVLEINLHVNSTLIIKYRCPTGKLLVPKASTIPNYQFQIGYHNLPTTHYLEPAVTFSFLCSSMLLSQSSTHKLTVSHCTPVSDPQQLVCNAISQTPPPPLYLTTPLVDFTSTSIIALTHAHWGNQVQWCWCARLMQGTGL